MSKPLAEWTEDDVFALPSGENDSFERKGARLVDLTISGVSPDAVLNELAKQLSAFANTGGGRIIYGISDTGTVDNRGVARSVKGRQPTREWLEDVIPTLTEYEIVGFNVYEIVPKASGSALAVDKSLYIVDVPDSDRAPHQSKRDQKYYVRLAGKSHPAPHRLIEDIRNRSQHPKITVENLRIHSANYLGSPQPTGQVIMVLELHVRNRGRMRAANTALLLQGNIPLSVTSPGGLEFFLRESSQVGGGLIELKHTMYPEMEIRLSVLLTVAASIQGPAAEFPEGV
jgi:hypothetical protein